MSLQYQIKGVAESLFNEASTVSYYEQIRFLIEHELAENKEMAIKTLEDWSTNGFSFPNDSFKFRASNKIMVIDIDNDLAKDYGISNFNNFSVNYCNFLSLFALGELSKNENKNFNEIMNDTQSNNNIRKIYKSYFENELASKDVKTWRDKVGAHYAITDKRKENIATLNYLISVHPTLNKWRYEVGATNLAINDESSEFNGWSVTKEYEKLSSNDKFRPFFESLNLGTNLYKTFESASQ